MTKNYTTSMRSQGSILEKRALTFFSVPWNFFKFNRRKNSIVISMLFVLMYCNISAQVTNYTFAQSTTTYTTAPSPTTVHASGWDDGVTSVTIPFSFIYNGTSYTSCNVATNGFVTLGTTAPSTTNYNPISGSETYVLAVSAFGRDLIDNGTTIVRGVSGSSPNRVFILQWNNARRYNLGAITGDVLNFQIRFYETSNKIEIVYGTCSASSTSNANKGEVGLRGLNNTSYNNRSGGNNTAWASLSAGNANTDTVNFKSTVVPVSGLTFTWTPPPPPTITSFASSGCVGSSLVINGTNLSGATAVTIGGTAATITANTATSVTVTVGSGTTGAIAVSAANGSVTSGSSFTVNQLPTATWASSATNVCYSSSIQSTPLSYSATTSSPNTYSITWNASPTNSFVPVSNASFSGTSTGGTISISVPAGTNPGTYTGTISVKNANNCNSTSQNFTITINPLPPTTTGVTICQGGSGSLTSSTPCTGFVNSGTSISGTWVAATDLTARRPTASISNTATCSFDASINRNYTVRDFQVTTTGNYTFEMNDSASFDGMGYIVSGSYVPGNCAGGGTWIKGDDDGGIAGNEPLMTATLTAGVTYTLISTTYSTTTGTYSGSYGWTITPPSGAQIMLLGTGTINWYTAASGGSPIGTGNSFNPVGVAGSGLSNTNTAGTTTFYAACSLNASCRTATTFTINTNVTYFQDADSDGFGNPSVTQVSCSGMPVGYVLNNSDCNDNQLRYTDSDSDGFGVLPLVACGGALNNSDCNDNQLRYTDSDSDGFGALPYVACGGLLNNLDCNDNQLNYTDSDSDGFGVLPLIACGGALNNTDTNDNLLTYVDFDSDGFGSTTFASSGVTNNSDCNDNQLQYTDSDSDGFGALPYVACGGLLNNLDCNDNQLNYTDSDSDGFGALPLIACGGVLNNTDSNDNLLTYVDFDGDGFGSTTFASSGVTNNSDCNDNQLQYTDSDSDGFGALPYVACGGLLNNLDCNDNQLNYTDSDSDGFGALPLIACGGVLNNTDSNDNLLTYVDFDGDGFGSTTFASSGVTNNSDCNDNQLQYTDIDSDGFGALPYVACGGLLNNLDCNDNQLNYTDSDSDGFGALPLIACGGVLNNTDSNDNLLTYVDFDGDGFGSTTFASSGVTNNSDCNDNQLQYSDSDSDGFGALPYVACGGLLNNTDCNDNQVRYLDADADGYGSVAMIKVACGGSLVATDCDDAKASINPGAVDVCYDGLDNDCNGNIDNVGLPGGCIPKIANLQSASCGATVGALNTVVSASNVPGAQAFRFKITNMTTMAVQTLDSPTISFQFMNLPGVTFGTQYKVEVAIRFAGVWQGFYGTPCFVNTPSPVSIISSAQCGSTLTSMSQYINSSYVANVTGYRYEVTNQSKSQTQYVYSSMNKFTLAQLLPSNQTFATNYFVRVACRNTDGTYLPEGAGCIVKSPAFPTTQVVASLCNNYLVPSMATNITVDPVAGATLYKFRLFNGTYDFVVESVYNKFTLAMFPGLEQGTLYSVQAAVQVGGIFDMDEMSEQKWGKTCTLTTPNAARQIETPSTPRLEVVVNDEFNALAYPNPFAANFKLNVTTNSEENLSVRVYDMLGKLVEDRKVNASDVETLEVGANYPSGVYNVIVTQGENTKTLRVIKR